MLQEYEGLTNKIHELQIREQELQEHLFSEFIPIESPVPPYDYQVLPVPGDQLLQPCVPAGTSAGNVENVEKGAMKNMVKAYLPNKQTTTVKVVFLMIMKYLQLYILDFEILNVFKDIYALFT